MRRDAGAKRRRAHVGVEQAAHAANGDALTAIVDEKRIVFSLTDIEIGANRLLGLRSERYDPLLRSFSADFHQSRAQLDVVEIDADELADAQPRRAQQFEPRAIADAQR